jgi:predicted TPR repeat methyltransferase
MTNKDLLNRASLLRIHGMHKEAVELLRSQSETAEFSSEVAALLYLCLVEMDLIAEATAHLESWLATFPSNEVSHEVASHLFSSLTGSPLPERAPSKFITLSFDAAAATSDQSSQEFQYRGPELFHRLLVDSIGTSDALITPLNRVLDAGCGTGRLSEVLRSYATELYGVDLSPQMLTAAKATQAYDHLECEDIITYLTSSVPQFDMIAAADSFNYFGNLKQLISACFSALRIDGWLVFSLQEGPLDKDSYFLRYDGSYIHSPQYLIEQLGEAGVLGGSIRRAVIRQQFGQNIWALLIAVQRPNEE